MRIGLIINPSSGRGKGAARGQIVLQTLAERGQEFVNLSGKTMDEANANARHAINDGSIDGLIVVGGDGIAHLGVNIACDTGIGLGIIAAGTGNDLARSIGLPEGDVVAGTHSVLDK
jgi:diacylglycerol kinase (ATP)